MSHQRVRYPAMGLPFAFAALLTLGGCSEKARVAVPVAAKEGNASAASVRSVVRAQAADEKEAKTEAKEVASATPFRLPDDKGGNLLGRVLQPTPLNGVLPEGTRPYRPLPPPPEFGATLPPLPAIEPSAPRLPSPLPPRALKPQLVTEEGFDNNLEPAVPTRPAFATEERARIPSADVRIPPPLPVLGQPVPDRVSLEDATTEASAAAVLSASLPARTNPAPYQRIGNTDPFENRKPLTTPAPAEAETPQSGTPQVGKP